MREVFFFSELWRHFKVVPAMHTSQIRKKKTKTKTLKILKFGIVSRLASSSFSYSSQVMKFNN